MNFSVISPEEARKKFEQSTRKISMLNIIADLTVSTKEEVAEFLGVKLVSHYPYVIDD